MVKRCHILQLKCTKFDSVWEGAKETEEERGNWTELERFSSLALERLTSPMTTDSSIILYVCITLNQPDIKFNPNPNPNPTCKQHAVVSIRLSIVTYVFREILTRHCYCDVCTTLRRH